MKRKAVFLAIALILILTSSIFLKNLFDNLPLIGFGGEGGGKGGTGGEGGKGEGNGGTGGNGGKNDGEGTCPCSQGTVSPEGGIPPNTSVFKVSGAAHTKYLSNMVASIYDGHFWRLNSSDRNYVYHGEQLDYGIQMFSSFDRDTITITPLTNFSNFMPTSIYTIQVSSKTPLVYYPEQGVFYSKEIFRDQYSFTTIHYRFNEKVLENARTIEGEQYLQLPDVITSRTRTLAYEITKGQDSPYGKAKAIEEYLKNNYKYDTSYTRAPSDREPVDYFLFEERKGVCANFNSAFVILARCVGIPARLVSGFSISPVAEEQTVYANQTHCWAEVGFETLGWIAFDATGGISGTSGCCEKGGSDENGDNGKDGENDNVQYETFTEITFVSTTSIEKGRTFLILGRVRTANNEPVNEMPVTVYLTKTKGIDGTVCGEGKTENGIFNITCTVPVGLEVSYYHVIVHSVGVGKYLESWSDPQIKVFSSTCITINIPKKVEWEKSINMSGMLTEECGAPIANHIVSFYVDQTFLASVITDKNGHFSVNNIFNQIGKHIVEAKFYGTEFYRSSNAIVNVEVTVVKIGMLTNPVFIRGEAVELYGRVWAGGSNLTNEPVLILMDNTSIAQTVTDEHGAFNYGYLVKQNERLGNHIITYRLVNFNYMEEQDVVVKARTTLDLAMPNTVFLGENFTVYVTLVDNLGTPIPNASIWLKDFVNTTNADGVTSFSMNVPQNYTEEKTCVEVSFVGEGNYLPSESTKNIQIQRTTLWLVMVIPVIGVGGIVGGYFFWKRRRKNASEQTDANIPILQDTKPVIIGTQQIRSMTSIEITYPQIESSLPDLWGLNEEFQMKFSLADDKGNAIDGKIIKISIGEKPVKETLTDGKNLFSYKFGEKGEYELGCRFEGDGAYTPSEKKRLIRIVDYREEIISLFNSFLAYLQSQGIQISKNETPRETQRKVLKARKVGEDELEKVVRCFEEAQYSTHFIERKHYVTMFHSLNQVKKDVG